MKFGGTSVGSADRMKHVAALITAPGELHLLFFRPCRVQQMR